MDSPKIPDDALADCLNVEINNPLLAIGTALGVDTDIVVPQYSGSRSVAIRRWSVDQPSKKEITTLIRASSNLLLYSEDFEMTAGWTFTAGGATLTPNSGAAQKRYYDYLTNISNTTKLEQTVTNLSGTYVFSCFFRKETPGSLNVRVTLDGTSTTQTITGFAGWYRVEVTKSGVSASSVVAIDFPNATGTEDMRIWGAQLEVGATATGYGYTANYSTPYYFFMYPYYNGSAWVDDWMELNEFRCGKVTSVTATTIVSTNFGESNDYFNGWDLQEIGTNANGGYVADYVSASGTFTVNDTTGVAGNDFIIVSRMTNHQNIIINSTTVTEENINFNEYVKTQTIGLGVGCTPVIVEYLSKTFFSTSAKPLAFSGFIIEAENLYYDSAYTDTYAGGIDVGISGAGAGSTIMIPAGVYTYFLVAVADGQRYCIKKSTFTVLSTYDTISMNLWIFDAVMAKRIEKLELYWIPTAGSTYEPDAVLQYESSLLTGTWTHSSGGNKRYISSLSGVTTLSTLTTSLTQNIQRSFDTKSIATYDYRAFLRGRSYIGGVNISNGALTPVSYDYMRFSSIANLVQEINVYPFAVDSSYGYIIAEAGSAEDTTGIGVTPQNDLLIFKNKSTFLYEVSSQSSQLGKRLVNAFKGIGCSNWRGIVNNSDYGTFFFDDNDIYQYLGGINPPKRISLGKVSKYWRSLRNSSNVHFASKEYGDLASGFAFFNKKLNELWVFVRVTEANGGTYADYKVLRYSVEFDNWNIMQFSSVIVGITDDLNSEVKLLTSTGDILKYGYTTTNLLTPYFTTHKIPFTTLFKYKRLAEISINYSSDQDVRLYVYLNDETNPRTGNSPTFSSSNKNFARGLRDGSVCYKASIKCAQVTPGDTFKVSEIGINYEKATRRFGR